MSGDAIDLNLESWHLNALPEKSKIRLRKCRCAISKFEVFYVIERNKENKPILRNFLFTQII